MLHVVLFQPEIPHNTGAIGRLCLAAGARLHLIQPLGFSLDDKNLRRAGLDYWQEVDVRLWESWQALHAGINHGTPVYFIECMGEAAHWDADLSQTETYLVFGPETRSLPESIVDPATCLRIPMKGTRSLNLATAAGIVMYEALRQRARAGIVS
ncbi:MAG: tRNA (cytidine(34)-2'-O)-methyltransferase [Prosthecobacter sp.]